jgi:hypothetical protein
MNLAGTVRCNMRLNTAGLGDCNFNNQRIALAC